MLTPLLLALPAGLQAQWNYTTNGDTITITGYTGPGGPVTVPRTINGQLVTALGWWAFAYHTNLSSVVIADSVTDFGWYLFYGCTGLTNVNLPSTVKFIGPSALEGCTGLARMTIPNSVAWIDERAFFGCTGLTDVFIPDSVTRIADQAFSGCTGLRSVTIPTSVNSIGNETFSVRTGLTSLSIPNGVTNFGSGVFSGCTGLTNMAIPDSMAEIPARTFAGCTGLTRWTIPNSVTNVDANAFYGCSGLTNVTIGSGVIQISAFAVEVRDFEGSFAGCTGLRSFTVDPLNPAYSSRDGVLFNKSQDTLISWPEGKQGSYVVPDGVVGFADYAFVDCAGLTSVTIGAGVTNISAGGFRTPATFYGCVNLTNLTVDPLNPSYSSRDGVLFDKGGALLIAYPQAKPGGYVVPDDVTGTSTGSVFEDCAGLTSVVIGRRMTNVPSFSGCTGLTNIAVDPLNPVYSSRDGVLFDKDQDVLLCYSEGRVGEYVIPSGVTDIAGAFAGCAGLTSVTMPQSVTSIGRGTFAGCTGLTNVSIPDSVAYIDDSAFEDCTWLTSVTIGKGVTSIGDFAFQGCTGLTNLVIPNGVTSIWSYAFQGCSSLASLTIGNGVTSLGEDMFVGCSELRSAFFLGDAPTTVGPSWFEGATNVIVYYLPGATGWAAALGGRPALLWNPTIQLSDAAFGVQAGGFEFNIAGTPDIPLVVEATSNLSTGGWIPVRTLTLTNGLVAFRDSAWTDYPARFYRIRSP